MSLELVIGVVVAALAIFWLACWVTGHSILKYYFDRKKEFFDTLEKERKDNHDDERDDG